MPTAAASVNIHVRATYVAELKTGKVLDPQRLFSDKYGGSVRLHFTRRSTVQS